MLKRRKLPQRPGDSRKARGHACSPISSTFLRIVISSLLQWTWSLRRVLDARAPLVSHRHSGRLLHNLPANWSLGRPPMAINFAMPSPCCANLSEDALCAAGSPAATYDERAEQFATR